MSMPHIHRGSRLSVRLGNFDVGLESCRCGARRVDLSAGEKSLTRSPWIVQFEREDGTWAWKADPE